MLIFLGVTVYVLGGAIYIGVLNAFDQKYHPYESIMVVGILGISVWPFILLPCLYCIGMILSMRYLCEQSNKLALAIIRKMEC